MKVEREYDVVKLHSVYVQHVHTKERTRIANEINLKKKELTENKSSRHLREKIEHDIRRLEKDFDSDHLTNYLLETIPMLTSYHAVSAKIDALSKECKGAPNVRTAATEKLENYRREKSMIVSRYLRRFYPDLASKSLNSRQKHFVDHRVRLCCGKEPIQQDDCSVCCSVCGLVLAPHEIDGSDPSRNLSYNRNVSAASSFSYKRINHLRELLRQLQGKTTSSMPKEEFERVMNEIRKQTIPRARITSFHIRKILKKLRLHRYYEQVVSLTKRINPEFEAISISPEYEEKLVFQFLQLEAPFEAVRSKISKNRKNLVLTRMSSVDSTN